MSAPDKVYRPAAERVFSSADGAYRLTIASSDSWRSPKGTATLVHLKGGRSIVVWKHSLPHHHGPRAVVVSSGGQAVLIDEWINTPSRYAITLVGRSGAEVAAYSFDEVVTVLGVARRTVSQHAKLGVWLSADPVLTKDERALVIHTAGRVLTVAMDDGLLSVS